MTQVSKNITPFMTQVSFDILHPKRQILNQRMNFQNRLHKRLFQYIFCTILYIKWHFLKERIRFLENKVG